MQASYTALTHAGATPYVLVSDLSCASAALAFFMHRSWCSLHVRCLSMQAPSHLVASLINLTKPLPTRIFTVSFGCRCFIWPRLPVNSADSVVALSNSSYHLFAQSMLTLVQASSFLTIWFTSLPVASDPTLSTKDRPSTQETFSLTDLMSHDVSIAMTIGDIGEPCGMPASTRCLCITLPSITISTLWSVRERAFHRMRSLCIPLPLIVWISLPLHTLRKAALMFIGTLPAMWASLQAVCALSTMIAAASIDDRLFLLPYWPLLSSPLLEASSASCSATTISTTCPCSLVEKRSDLH